MKFVNSLSKRDSKFLERAVEVAAVSSYPVFRHGALIVKNGNVLAVGVNVKVNDPEILETNEVSAKHASIHAEVAALNACRKMNLQGASIYVARVYKDGSPAMSKPCSNCQKVLREAGVKKVFYTIESGFDL